MPSVRVAEQQYDSAAEVDVMVIDDDSLILEFFRRQFRRQSIPLRTYLDAEEAITEFRQRPASILFVDSRMPLVDGIEVLETLAAENALSGTLAFLCSAAQPPPDVQARAGAVGVPVMLKEVQCDKDSLAALLERAGSFASAPPVHGGDMQRS